MKIPCFSSILLTLITAGSVFATTPAQLAEQLYQEGATAEKAGDPATAEARYAAALKANPNHASARFSLGQVKINAASIIAHARETKIGAVMIPLYQLENASLQEALAALSQQIETQSKQTITPNFIIEDPQGKLAAQKISLNLKNLPAQEVMRYLLNPTNARVRYDEHAVVIMSR